MKRLLLSAIMIAAAASTLYSQDAARPDNKPGAGSIGVWYGVSFVPVSQSVLITGYATKNIEVGGSIGLSFSRTSASTYENTTVFTSGFGTLPGQTEHRLVQSSTSFSIAPMVLYHFNIKSNVDLGLGGNVPISISTPSKSTQSDITTADNYNSTNSVVNKRPISAGGGLGLLVSCKWFFYKNLAIGAMANFGFMAYGYKGNEERITSFSNSGSNNPDNSSSSTSTLQRVSGNSQSYEMLHNFNLNLSWYFGTKKTTASN